MKRKILFPIVLCLLTLLVTGCKSSDYKEAQSLYTKGDYASAKTMFEELADYEDSQDMVIECTYQLALQQVESGNYQDARDVFVELGEYKDCRTRVRTCSYYLGKEALQQGAFDDAEAYLNQAGDYEDAKEILNNLPSVRLMYFLEDHGELSTTVNVSEYSIYDVTMKKLTDDTIEIIYEFNGKRTTIVNNTKTTMILTLGDPQLKVQGTHNQKLNFMGRTSTIEESAEGVLDIRTYRYGDEMLFDKTYFKGNDVYGDPLDPNVSSFYLTSSNAPLERAFQAIEEMLVSNNVGVTLNQLGFASL